MALTRSDKQETIERYQDGLATAPYATRLKRAEISLLTPSFQPKTSPCFTREGALLVSNGNDLR